jgi:hypothetical protein
VGERARWLSRAGHFFEVAVETTVRECARWLDFADSATNWLSHLRWQLTVNKLIVHSLSPLLRESYRTTAHQRLLIVISFLLRAATPYRLPLNLLRRYLLTNHKRVTLASGALESRHKLFLPRSSSHLVHRLPIPLKVIESLLECSHEGDPLRVSPNYLPHFFVHDLVLLLCLIVWFL